MANFTPCQKIKLHILTNLYKDDDCPYQPSIKLEDINSDNIDYVYEEFFKNDAEGVRQEEEAFRTSGVRTNIEPERSRNYESCFVVKALADGTLVGWTYWYGGGKHGEPESMSWMEHAYGVEGEKVEITRTEYRFTKIGDKNVFGVSEPTFNSSSRKL